MIDHVNEPKTNDPPPLTEAQQAIQQLAAVLHRPPQSLAAFSHLTPDQLGWLTARVELICMQEDTKLREELHHAIPRFLRRLLLGRLRSSS